MLMHLLFLVANYLLGFYALTIKVGMIGFEKTQPAALSFSRSAGIIPYVMNTLAQEGKLNNISFEFYTHIVECETYKSSEAMGKIIEFIEDKKVDVLIPGPCARMLRLAGTLSTFYKIPMLSYGYAFQTELSDSKRFPYNIKIAPNTISLSVAFVSVIKNLQWMNFSLISVSDSDYCNNIMSSIESYAGVMGVNVPGVTNINLSNKEATISRLKLAKQRTRIFAYCASDSIDKRNFLVMADAAGLNTPEYVFIILEMRSVGMGQFEALDMTRLLGSARSPFWLDIKNNNADGNDAIAAKMADLCFMLDTIRDVDGALVNRTLLRDQIFQMVKEPPINCNSSYCTSDANANQEVAHFAYYLHDVFYSFVSALNKTLTKYGTWNADTLMESISSNFTGFQGLSGRVTLDENGNRQADYQLTSLNTSGWVAVRLTILLSGNVSEVIRSTGEGSMWATRNGHRPLNVPICGYSGTECPLTTWEQYSVVIIACCTVGFLLILAIVGSCVFILLQRRNERQREDREWQISFYTLTKKVLKEKTDRSQRSLASNPSTMTSKTSNSTATVKHSFNVMFRDEEPLIVKKISITTSELIEKRDQITALRKIEHDNLNSFVGLSVDVTPQYALWKLCERGTLREVIAHNTGRIDGFFMVSMISDIVTRLWCLHKTALPCHGQLTSRNCYVTDSWQVKISDFGMDFARSGEKKDKFEKLYHAPEILRGSCSSKVTDVYALAIVISEIVTLKLSYAINDDVERMDEVLYFLKKGGSKPPRPEATVGEEVDINIAMLHLMRDCWDEEPKARPTMDIARNVIRTIKKGKQQNLMDYAMMQMEEYACKLEMEVEEQSREIVEEKKRSDLLLYTMLPKTVADKLKLGQSVEPESFESVTIFFSDIVKFTQLAAKCSPFQIVSLLNELFTAFDNLIDKHSVYKVETIGDGYLCVSGLPFRNGNLHIRDIAEMSLDFMEACNTFRVRHLPAERVQLRIGVNSGPCVAGVVGLTMPRYCLFGDVVNTGSRMESNSKPGKIHMTSDAHKLLTAFGGYHTESRGDVIIKGKGVMETHWLIGRAHNERNNNVPSPVSTIQQPERHNTVVSVNEEDIARVLSRPATEGSLESLGSKTPETERMYQNYRSGAI